MHAIHLHPRRSLLAAVAAFGLALAALMPATLGDASFSLGSGDRVAPAQPAATAATTTRAEPAWSESPFAYPLLQMPRQ